MSTALVKSNLSLVPNQPNLQDTLTLGKVLAESGFFSDSRQAAQACVKVLAGQELGLGPVASMTGIHLVQGKVTLSANLIASLVKKSGRYDYQVKYLDNDGCAIEFFDRGEPCGTSTFSEKDAKDAGLFGKDIWKKFPRNMYFSRAISNGARWYCPEIFAGPVYTPEEFDYPMGTVSENPQPVEPTPAVEVTPEPLEAPKPEATPKRMSKAEAEQIKQQSIMILRCLQDCGFEPAPWPSGYDEWRGQQRLDYYRQLRSQLEHTVDTLAGRCCDEGKLSDGEMEDSVGWTEFNTDDLIAQVRRLFERIEVNF